MDPVVKEEMADAGPPLDPVLGAVPMDARPWAVIDLISSSSDSDSDDEDCRAACEVEPRARDGGLAGDAGRPLKKRRSEDGAAVALPLGFLEPLAPEEPAPLPPTAPISVARPPGRVMSGCRQFWKAGEYESSGVEEPSSRSAGMDHVRVHPKFLHSNATSHKWALGAIAELLDNVLDEVPNGATFVNIDMLENKEDKTRMLLVEDNGGGMDPHTMRQCMSLGYSAKSKLSNTIGQYGNGFKTSTMRLGADVIVFSRCRGKGGKSSTQSIGLLSYTYLMNTGKEDTVIPMIDFEKGEENWNKLMRSCSIDWSKNLDTIVQWSPYRSEADLLQQFGSMSDQGTRMVIYNLWEDDQGELELDFDADKYDIQLRGVNRDEKKIQMAKQFPNSRHFLTYRHSLRSYASILYLRLPQGFRMILRGKEIEHHNIVNDMMLKQEVTYKPQSFGDGAQKDQNMVAVVTIGFVKDAKDHIDVQGFNVYHKNRLIKPFWRVWNIAGSDGRGVIGVLEANFVEPAHDKQDFERTTVLARLEARLIHMQRNYWRTEAHRVGYAPRVNEKVLDSMRERVILPEASPNNMTTPVGKSQDSTRAWSSIGKSPISPVQSTPVGKSQDSTWVRSSIGKNPISPVQSTHVGKSQDSTRVQSSIGKSPLSPVQSNKVGDAILVNGHSSFARESGLRSAQNSGEIRSNLQPRVHKELYVSNESDYGSDCVPNGRNMNGVSSTRSTPVSNNRTTGRSCPKEAGVACIGNEPNSPSSSITSLEQLKLENHELKDRLKQLEDDIVSLTEKLEEAKKKLEKANKEQEALIDIFTEERSRRDKEEEILRKKLKDASLTIQELLEKLNSHRNSKGGC